MIYKKNLIHNLNEYQKKYPKLALAPVLKSNAYGHGLIQVARILDKEQIAFLAVDSLFEATILRHEDIKSNILIIGYTSAENIGNSKISNTAFTITSLEQLKEINASLRKEKKFHLKIDTGMHRQGIMPKEILEAIKIIRNNQLIKLEGVCSHLADADNERKDFTEVQIKNWHENIEIIKRSFKNLKFFHLAATSGMAHADKIQANVARLGIGLYGINAAFEKLNLKPVLEMQSVISSARTIEAGESVGYGAAFKTDRTMRIATVPVGYSEGVDRRLSNVGCFKFNSQKCSIVGRVSMNITSVDLGTVSEIKIGDKVVVISSNSQEENSVENMAKLAHTIPYDILVHIPQHLRRIVK